MKILVNTSNLKRGGAVQKGVQFWLSICEWGEDHFWRVVLSPEVAESVDLENVPTWISFVICPVSPARLIDGIEARKLLKREEKIFEPDAVFSVFGPTYYIFKNPHLMGFAIPWVTHPTALAWKLLRPLTTKAIFYFKLKYYAFWAKFADEWVLESEVSAVGLSRKLGKDYSRFHVVPNSCSEYYLHPVKIQDGERESRLGCQIRLLVFTSYKPHKNLFIIPEIARVLREIDLEKSYKFVFTIPVNSPAWKRIKQVAEDLGVDEDIHSVGYIPVESGPELYSVCDGLFLPTVLETFSANYPEAMAMRRPIITSDLDFAQDVCADAASYFNPISPYDGADAICRVFNDDSFKDKIIEAGSRRLADFGSGKDRFLAVVRLLNSLRARYGKD